MCGITGYINTSSKRLFDSEVIWNMLRVQKHRGPDDTGIISFNLKSGISQELDTKVPCSVNNSFEGVLGFNRLSILDLSLNGHQPMSSPDGRVLLALNGEIYNAFDFKEELLSWGYKFKSTSDTEIVLALYLKYGFDGLVSRLNGMFAFVIIDFGRKELIITRDRFGIKPMYYILAGDIFAFSSELKSFSYLKGFKYILDEEQIDEYLIFRNNLNGTLYKNIESLKPGYFLTYTHEKGPVIKRYFNINDYSRSVEHSGDLDTYIQKLEGWLSKSVQSQLMSDVKLGCQLSGGIDSTLVTWFANKNNDKGNFEAVSILFNDPRFNEEKYVDIVTKKLAIPSHKFLLNSDYYLNNIENATWHLEAPINHPNTIAIYKLSQQAKKYVTVLLSGEGADEVFGGYERFYDINFPFQTRRLLHEIKKNFKSPSAFVKYFNHESRAIMATAFMTAEIAKKIRKSIKLDQAIDSRISLYRNLSGSSFDRQVKYEMCSYLPDLLVRQDKMSMAHSIENRVPFLDNEVVEKSFTLPEKYLLLKKSPEGYNTQKYLLKKMTANTFGKEFAFREKMGFGIPVREFFLNRIFFEYLNDKVLPGIKRRGLFNYELITGWIYNIRSLSYMELEALWIVIAFEIWASIYLDSNYENSYT